MQDLKDVTSRFSFGENWASYAKSIGDVEIDEAVAGLRRLTGTADLAGKRFLDIGCGSGIHCLAALPLGAAGVVAVDIDADSVATTEAMLVKHAGRGTYRVERCSVFDLSQRGYGAPSQGRSPSQDISRPEGRDERERSGSDQGCPCVQKQLPC